MKTPSNLPVSKAFLSTRTSIAWLPDPPSEPTDTLVLTGSRWYIDLRSSKEEGQKLAWGMAGVKEFVGGSKDQPRARFTNHLDSQRPDLDPSMGDSESDVPADEGTFILLPSGQTLESGSMLNPDTGLVQPYEEIWSNVFVPPGEQVLILVRRSSSTRRPAAFIGLIGAHALAIWQEHDSQKFGAWKAEQDAGGAWAKTWEQPTKVVSKDQGPVGVALPEGEQWDRALGPAEGGAWPLEGSRVWWDSHEWEILERGSMGRGRVETTDQ